MKPLHPLWPALLGATLLLVPAWCPAQSVGIGTTTPQASAALDVTSATQGVLLPRLSLTQRQALGTGNIAPPVAGLVLYQIDNTPGLYAYDGTTWVRLGGADNLGNHTATQNLNLQANALVGTGADIGKAVGVGVRADGGLNLGQNALGNTPGANIYLGYQAGQANTSGFANQFSGYQSGYSNTTGSRNVFSGAVSGYFNTTGSYNLFDGCFAGYSNTTGTYNQFCGAFSGYSNTTGSNNLFSGALSGYANTTGNFNQFSGYQSGYSNTTGGGNVFSGFKSGYANTSGNSNVFTGIESGLLNTTGSFNVFSGLASGYANTTASDNVFSGFESGFNNTTGHDNQFSGYESGLANTLGSYNLFSGGSSGRYNTTGDFNTALGFNSGPANGGGNISNATAVGANVTLTQSNTVVLGNAANVGIGTSAPAYLLDVAGTLRCAGFLNVSDQRLKTNIRPLGGALAAVLALRGVRYQWNARGVRRGGQAQAEQLGLLAQEVARVYPELVSTDAQGYQAVNYAQLTPVLIEALKELAARNAALEAQLAAQQRTAQAQQASLTGLAQRLRALEAAGAQASR